MSVGLADLPLALIVVLWWCSAGADAEVECEASARLERWMAGILLAGASAALWNATLGGVLLARQWPLHLALAVIAASALSRRRSPLDASDLPLPALLGRVGAYAGGLALAAVSSGWSFGQYALSAW